MKFSLWWSVNLLKAVFYIVIIRFSLECRQIELSGNLDIPLLEQGIAKTGVGSGAMWQ